MVHLSTAPRNADPRGPAQISGAPAAEVEGRTAGLGQSRARGEGSVPWSRRNGWFHSHGATPKWFVHKGTPH